MSNKGKMMVNGRNASWTCCSRHDPTSQGQYRQLDKRAARQEIDEELNYYYDPE